MRLKMPTACKSIGQWTLQVSGTEALWAQAIRLNPKP